MLDSGYLVWSLALGRASDDIYCFLLCQLTRGGGRMFPDEVMVIPVNKVRVRKRAVTFFIGYVSL